MLKFLRFSSGLTAQKDVDLIDKAAQYAKSNQIEVEIIKDAEDIKTLLSDEHNDKQPIYVCFPFEGKVFESMKKKNYRIIGPQCVMSCLLMEISVPKQTYPISNVAMLNCSICCSSMKKDERMKIHDLVLTMGGEITTAFTTSVTHLVAKEVGSNKYVVACTKKIPVVSPDWVYSCWERSKYNHFLANETNVIKEFQLSIFQGCTICVTGLDSDTRERIKDRVRENGGIYSGELNMKTCTHLLVEKPHGEKYTYARHWKLHCVSPVWLFDCLKAGHWIEEKPYYVEPNSDTTVNQSLLQKPNVHDTLRESMMQNSSYRKSLATKAAEIAAKSYEKSKSESKESELKCKCNVKTFPSNTLKISKLSFPEESNSYLDGYHIYLCNKPGPVFDCCRKIINNGGGTRHSTLMDNLTHIIVWDQVPVEIQNFLLKVVDQENHPQIVSPQWLIDCFEALEAKPEIDYDLIENNNSTLTEIQSDNVFKKPIAQPVKQPALSSSLHFNLTDIDGGDDSTLLHQYMSNNHESTRLSQVNGCATRKTSDEDEKTAKEDDTTVTMEEEPLPAILKEKTFCIQRFDEQNTKNIVQMINEYGGRVVDKVSESDHVIVPLSYNKKMEISKKELTLCWLERSLEEEELKSPSSSFFYRPIFISAETKPLVGCVVTASQFDGMERQHIYHLTELLGGVIQDSFSRKANTHLVLMKPEGSKYNASLKWKVPCVSKLWLYQCAKTGKRVSEEDFPVTEEQIEENYTLTEKMDQTTNEMKNASNMETNAEETAAISFQLSNRGASLMESHPPVNPDLNDGNHKTSDLNDGTHKSSSEPPDLTVKETVFVADKDSTSENIDFTAFNNMISKEKTATTTPKTPVFSSASLLKDNNKKNISHESPAALKFSPFDMNKSKYSFDFTDALASIDSPFGPSSQDLTYSARRKSRRSRGSIPFDVQFSEALQNAVDKLPPEQNLCFNNEKKVSAGVLANIVVVVSKKLVHRQTELHTIVHQLGGDTRFTYDSSCTHFIHQGSLNDKSKDFVRARKEKKLLVSPYWIETCLQTDQRAAEDKYPISYNPRLSIDVDAKKPEQIKEPKVNLSSTNVDLKSPTRKIDDPAPKPSESDQDCKADITENDKTAEVTTGDISAHTDDKLDFQKKMTEIMAATKAPRSRKGRRQTNTSVTKNDTNNLSNSRRLRSRTSSQKSNESSSSSSTLIEPKPIHLNEQSQGDFITYDDPTGRLERERILAQLKRASPSQDIESAHYPISKFVQDGNLENLNEEDLNNAEEQQTEPKRKQQSPIRSLQINTPKRRVDSPVHKLTAAPKTLDSPQRLQIALPITNESPKPEVVNLLEDEEEDERLKKEENAQNYRFLLSGLSAQEKIDYGAVIEKLGGIVYDVQYFNVQCSHVVVSKPSRNEKYLAAIASGKWVLHKSYLDASREHNDFVKEEDHEWGSQPGCNGFAASAKRWRVDLCEKRKTIPNVGAFNGWVVLLCIESAKQPGFKRILEAGGAKVLADRPPFENFDGATHVFIGDKNLAVKTQVDYELLHESGVWILRPEYISDYLTMTPKPPVFNYVLHEGSGSDDAPKVTKGKRKANEDSMIGQKRSKR